MISPEQFQVKSFFYPAIPKYWDFCATAANDLGKNPPVHLNALIDRLGGQIQDFYVQQNPEAESKGFGRVRDVTRPADSSATLLVNHYIPTFEHAVRGKKIHEGKEIKIVLPLPDWVDESKAADGRRSEVVLSRVEQKRTIGLAQLQHTYPSVTHFTSSDDNNTHNAEHVWSMLSQAYYTAMNEKKGKDERREAAIDTYWLMSHYMPFERGSATAARITLEFLAETIGFNTGITKTDCDLNLEALTRDRAEFQRDFDTFFEARVNGYNREIAQTSQPMHGR